MRGRKNDKYVFYYMDSIGRYDKKGKSAFFPRFCGISERKMHVKMQIAILLRAMCVNIRVYILCCK